VDKRLSPDRDSAQDDARRLELFQRLRENDISIPEAVRLMQRISRLTQPEFAEHRGVSTQALRQIISGKGNPTVDTLNKIAGIFGLEVGFVPKKPRRI
jgi:DNA-binding phage protein